MSLVGYGSSESESEGEAATSAGVGRPDVRKLLSVLPAPTVGGKRKIGTVRIGLPALVSPISVSLIWLVGIVPQAESHGGLL